MYIMRICRITVNRRLEGFKIAKIWGLFHKVTGGEKGTSFLSMRYKELSLCECLDL